MSAQENQIRELLKQIIHPESGNNIVDSGIVKRISVDESVIGVVVAFAKKRDPFATSIKRRIAEILGVEFPGRNIQVGLADDVTPANEPNETESSFAKIKNIIAIASGKGGVGKSTVTANLAATLRDMGFKVGILDADIYGPSMPKMFGLEGFAPQPAFVDGKDYILPAIADGIKISSIGFFISPDDALIWRGPMATNALRQLIHQTLWEELDYLLIDMPPGTGDVHLSVVGELKVTGAIVVSTPQQVAVADAVRGIHMFKADGIDVPVLGVIENMAWFTPEELPDNKYYIFGQGGARTLAENEAVDFLGDIPLVMSVVSGGDTGMPAVTTDSIVKKYYRIIADKIVNKTSVR